MAGHAMSARCHTYRGAPVVTRDTYEVNGLEAPAAPTEGRIRIESRVIPRRDVVATAPVSSRT